MRLQAFAPNVVVGSALVYSDNGAVLADALHRAFEVSAELALVLQMRGRIGFDRFLRRVTQLGDEYELSEVPEELYRAVALSLRGAVGELGGCDGGGGEPGVQAAGLPSRSCFVLCSVRPRADKTE